MEGAINVAVRRVSENRESGMSVDEGKDEVQV
jgi:hypothetical protein